MKTGNQSIGEDTDEDTDEDTAPSFADDITDDAEESVTLTVPATKVAALRRCARLLSNGGNECIAIEDIVMPVSQMTFDEAVHFARPILK